MPPMAFTSEDARNPLRSGMNAHPHEGTLLRNQTRKSAAAEAARVLRSGARPRALVGFDGFLDVILRAVDTRASMRTEDFTPIGTIGALSHRIAAAAGRSANIELVEVERRFGGNGPLLAGSLGALGAGVTYIGCVGEDAMEAPPGRVHDAFTPFASRCERVLAVAPPAVTHALEFGDGKIMFNMPQAIQGVTWATLLRDLGREAIIEAVRGADLIGVVNWSIMAGVDTILTGLRDDVLTHLSAGAPRKRMFIDLSDPAKRTRADLRRVLDLLASIQSRADVTLGLNLSEATQVASVLGASCDESMLDSIRTLPDGCITLAAGVQERLGLSCRRPPPPRRGGCDRKPAHVDRRSDGARTQALHRRWRSLQRRLRVRTGDRLFARSLPRDGRWHERRVRSRCGLARRAATRGVPRRPPRAGRTRFVSQARRVSQRACRRLRPWPSAPTRSCPRRT